MAKAKNRIIWKGKFYEVGDEVPSDVPKQFTTGEEQKPKEKVAAKVTTKRKKTKVENKNGKPKTDDK